MSWKTSFICSLASLLFAPLLAIAQPIKIGWAGPLTGNSAVLGVDSLAAAQMAVDEANAAGGVRGRPLELIAEDDAYDTTRALSAYTKLTSTNGVSAILMSTYGGVFATAPRAAKDGVIVINPLDCNSDIAALGANTLCIATETESIGHAIAEDITKSSYKRIAILYDESNPFMHVVERSIEAYLANHQGIERSSHAVSNSAGDFRSVLTRLIKVDAIVFLGHDPMGSAMAQARAMGNRAQFYTVGTITSPGFQSLAGAAAENTRVAYWEAPRTPELNSFLTRFERRVGRKPILELATTPSYDAMRVLILAIDASLASQGTLDPELLKANLLKVRSYQGVSGTITIDPDGAVRSLKEKIFRFSNKRLSE